ncbi:hypothetical protein K435DRAFT_204545 [Dendrothele bispora CBS 962.96]|uniref:Uncharacterized protein n=1 Tax=Dendrothele bispora (strain CBS 962.96) TaxID=1314807 RepID=A0A4S8LTF1_DENBC|nr:hypothetical protein K435DRAFT_204545 [Dendrothele bispora CBS 962.96]
MPRSRDPFSSHRQPPAGVHHDLQHVTAPTSAAINIIAVNLNHPIGSGDGHGSSHVNQGDGATEPIHDQRLSNSLYEQPSLPLVSQPTSSRNFPPSPASQNGSIQNGGSFRVSNPSLGQNISIPPFSMTGLSYESGLQTVFDAHDQRSQQARGTSVPAVTTISFPAVPNRGAPLAPYSTSTSTWTGSETHATGSQPSSGPVHDTSTPHAMRLTGGRSMATTSSGTSATSSSSTVAPQRSFTAGSKSLDQSTHRSFSPFSRK